MVGRYVSGSTATDFDGRGRRILKKHHIMREHVAFGGAGVNAQAGGLREAFVFGGGGEQDGFADAHETERDAGGFTGSRVAQVDAGIDGGCQLPEIAGGRISGAHNAGGAQQGRGGTGEIGGDEIAGHQQGGAGQAFEGAQDRHQALGFAQETEDAEDEPAWRDPQACPPAHCPGSGCAGGGLKQVRDLDDLGMGCVPPHHPGRCRVVDHDGAGAFGDAPQHGVVEESWIRRGARARAPQLFGQGAAPLAIVVDEFGDVLVAMEAAEEEVLERGVVQHGDPGALQGAPVDVTMRLVVAQMIEIDVAIATGFDGTEVPEGFEQGGGVVSHAGTGRRKGRKSRWSLPFPGPEQRGTHTHICGAFLDGHFQVMRHTHGEAGQAVLKREFAQAPEIGARQFRVIRPWRHSHEAGEHQVRLRADGRDQAGQVLGAGTGLGLLWRELHFDHDFERTSGLAQAVRQLLTIDGLDSLKQRGSFGGLVGLQVTDEVEAGVGQVREFRGLGLEFLDVVLAEIAQAERIGGADGGGREQFRDGDQADIEGSAAGTLRRLADPAQDLREVVGKIGHTVIFAHRGKGPPRKARKSPKQEFIRYTSLLAMPSAVEFQNVSKSYAIYETPGDRLKELVLPRRFRFHRDFWALKDVSFEIHKGETFCVIGENGSGKSTLLQIVARILHPTSGVVDVRGRVSALLELGAGFNLEFTGRDNVYLNGSILGLSTRQIDQRYRDIEEFAEIGDFINQPVKTYSSGMIVRLAFAVAINVDPEILLVDEALAVGDIYFRQRCMRKVHELRSRGITILFVSHSMGDVKAIGDRVLWLDKGQTVQLGDPDMVVAKYLAAMTEKDSAYLNLRRPVERDRTAGRRVAPEIVETIPNMDHRYGDGRAEVIGIAALDVDGHPVHLMEPGSRVVVRISVRAKGDLAMPNVGFMFRNHLGMDFAGTNTRREGVELEPMVEGDICTVDFHLDLPELYPGSFSFSPAIADGTLEAYGMCDWIDNAMVLQMGHSEGAMYGYMHLPCRVEVNARLNAAEAKERKVG